jgi:hypothetical protein
MTKPKYEVGAVAWMDLTVPNAAKVKDFYSKVTGWKTQPLSMDEYEDYVMMSPKTKKSISGICHKLGNNTEFPSMWPIYIVVKNLTRRINAFKKNSGKIIIKTQKYGSVGKYCVIQDPAGAVCALF